MVLLDTEGMVRSGDPSDPATSKRAPKRERTSAAGEVAPNPASSLESPNAAEEALVHRAQEQVSQSYQKAQADRAAAQRKANEKARTAAEQACVAAEDAKTLRKDLAAQAETDLYGFKTQALQATVEQVAEARAAEGREAAGSVPGIYTAKIAPGMPQPDQTVCRCGRRREFCAASTCLNTLCVPCSARPPWDCDFECCNLRLSARLAEIQNVSLPHQCRAKGRFCKDHIDTHLVTCQACDDKVCALDACQNCNLHFCERCLDEDDLICLFCQRQWAETYANLESYSTNSGFESEYDSDDD